MGEDGKPVFSGTPGDVITSADTFNQWYNDTEDVNISTTKTLTLEETSPGSNVYEFIDNYFFPIDGELYNDPAIQGTSDYEQAYGGETDENGVSDHNFHFTMELHAWFTYHPGQDFSIQESDDDMWLFIGGQLATDLGGIHPPASDTLDLDSLGLTPGETYTFDLFYAERHTDQSHLKFQTNIEDIVPVSEDETIKLIEHDDFETEHSYDVSIDEQTEALSIRYADLLFDINDDFVNDAFELALVDSDGNPLVPTIQEGRDAFFNVTEGMDPIRANGVTVDGNTVTVDVSHLPAGTNAKLVARLVNNDGDETTQVVLPTEVAYADPVASDEVTPPQSRSTGGTQPVDFSEVTDITSAFDIEYGRTSNNDAGNHLHAGLALTNATDQVVRGPLLVGVRGLDPATASLYQPDGVTPDGIPYYDVSRLAYINGDQSLERGDSVSGIDLSFLNPEGVQFDYDLVVLGHLNEAPLFTTAPWEEVREGQGYSYDADAEDPEGDAYIFSLINGPDGMTIDAETGEVQWATDSNDIGAHDVMLRVTDEYGASTDQGYTLTVVDSSTNRPPRFNSVPVVDAYVGTPYEYQATAVDPDGDDLTFSLGGQVPVGNFAITSDGLVTWEPGEDLVGQTVLVNLDVSDGHGGQDTQGYQIQVHEAAGNHDPIIYSDPPEEHEVTGGSGGVTGDVSPNQIRLRLTPGQTLDDQILYTLPEQGEEVGTTDIVLMVDESSSMSGEHEWLADMITQLDDELEARGITNNRFALVGFGGGGTHLPGHGFLLGAAYHVRVYDQTNTLVKDVTIDSPDAAADFTMPTDGDFTVVVDAPDTNGPFDADFLINDITDSQSVAKSGLDTELTGSISAGQTYSYVFTAPAGQGIYLDSRANDDTSLRMDLKDGDGNLVFSNQYATRDRGPIILDKSSSYTLTIYGSNSSATGDYDLRVVDLDNVDALGLDPSSGALATGTLPDTQTTDLYTFTAAAGQRVFFDSVGGNPYYYTSIRMYDPYGNRVNDFSTDESRPVTMPTDGRYTVVVNNGYYSSVDYGFRLADASQGQAITPDANVQGEFDPITESNYYTFAGTAGQRLMFDVTQRSGAGYAHWQLRDPYGNQVFYDSFGTSTSSADIDTLDLPYDGDYTLILHGPSSGSGTASYTFNVRSATPSTQALTLNNTVSDTLDTAGEEHAYTFTLNDDTLTYFDSLTNTGDIRWSLEGPDGEVVKSRPFYQSDSRNINDDNAVMSLRAGDYTLTVDGAGDATGAYSFRLLDLATAAIAITPGASVSDTLDPANQTKIYHFTASQGDKLYFDSVSWSGPSGGYWRLIDPSGEVVRRDYQRNDLDNVVLDSTGEYTLLIEGRVSNSGTSDYTFNAQPVITTGQSLTLDQPVSGTLSTVAAEHQYSFTVTDQSMLYLDAMTNQSNIRWSLEGPEGTVVDQRRLDQAEFGSWGESARLRVVPGDYVLTIQGYEDWTGAYSFALRELNSASTLTPGTAVTDTLDPGNGSHIYQFDATSGDRFYFDAQSMSGDANWTLIDPYGKVVFNHNFYSNTDYSDVSTQELGVTGTYTLVMEGDLDQSSTVNYGFTVYPVTNNQHTLTLNNSVSGSIATPGDRHQYNFTLSDDSLLYLDSLTNTDQIRWTLEGPSGTLVDYRRINDSDAGQVSDDSAVINAYAGDYTLTVEAEGDYTGGYDFTLWDLAAATGITPGTAVSGDLDPANETSLYSFDATAGDRMFFDVEQWTGPNSGRWRLVDPYGQVLFDTGITSDVATQELAQAGTYTLLIEGQVNQTGTASYTVNVQPEAVSTDTLNLDTTTSGTLSAAGERHEYTLTLANATRLTFDSLTNSNDLRWDLTGPSGFNTVVENRYFSRSDAACGHRDQP